MTCEDCKQAADLPAVEMPPMAELVGAPGDFAQNFARTVMRAEQVEEARNGFHERCRRRNDGCPCQHGDHGRYRPEVKALASG